MRLMSSSKMGPTADPCIKTLYFFSVYWLMSVDKLYRTPIYGRSLQNTLELIYRPKGTKHVLPVVLVGHAAPPFIQVTMLRTSVWITVFLFCLVLSVMGNCRRHSMGTSEEAPQKLQSSRPELQTQMVHPTRRRKRSLPGHLSSVTDCIISPKWL